jgi:hypothetical protein
MPAKYINPWPGRKYRYRELRQYQLDNPEQFEYTRQMVKSGPKAGQMGIGLSWRPRYKGRRAGPSWEKQSLMRRRIKTGGE